MALGLLVAWNWDKTNRWLQSFSSADDSSEKEQTDFSDSHSQASPSDSAGPGQSGSPSTNQTFVILPAGNRLPDEIWTDPRHDGWDTEVLSEQASAQLKKLAKIMAHPQGLSTHSPEKLLDRQFSSGKLRPPLRPVFQEAKLLVQRSDPSGQAVSPKVAYQRIDGFRQAVAQLHAFRKVTSDTRVKFKLFGVDKTPAGMQTRQYFTMTGETAEGLFEQTSTWVIHWKLSPKKLPVIARISVEAFEEVTLTSSRDPLFRDLTPEVLSENKACTEQLARGIDYYRARIETSLGIVYNGQHGIAVADVNGDGLDDVYLCQPGSLPNRLLIHQPDGTVIDRSAALGVDVLNLTQSALFVDLDNDRDQDLIVSTQEGLLIFANNGSGQFQVAWKAESVPLAYAIAAADYDNDGDVDLYFCRYYGDSDDPNEYPTPIPYQDANNGGANFLYQNNGQWQFEDVTKQVGLGRNNTRFSFAAAWEDYDNDGDPDLYVANDFGRNNLYRNDQGRFTDVAAEAGLEDGAFGMSVSWADYNCDGLMDVYVGNMFSAAGNRIAYQRKFKPGSPDALRSQLQRLARGNSLFENQGDGTFRDVSLQAGVTMGRWSWASLFADLNNDGFEDLLVANGYVTGGRVDDL